MAEQAVEMLCVLRVITYERQLCCVAPGTFHEVVPSGALTNGYVGKDVFELIRWKGRKDPLRLLKAAANVHGKISRLQKFGYVRQRRVERVNEQCERFGHGD